MQWKTAWEPYAPRRKWVDVRTCTDDHNRRRRESASFCNACFDENRVTLEPPGGRGMVGGDPLTVNEDSRET